MLDEFQDLLVARKDLDGLLRSRIQYHGDAAAYVYAGSEPSMMRELFDARERPLFGQADPLTIGPLPPDETIADLAEPLRRRGPRPRRVARRAGRLRRRATRSARCCSPTCWPTRSPPGEAPTPELAARVVDDALERTRPAHQALWQGLGRTERVVLAATADGIAPTSRSLATEHGLGRQTLDAAADRLVDQGHLIRIPRASRLVDPLLAEWLAAMVGAARQAA